MRKVHSGENIGESATHVIFVELKEGATASGAEPRLGPA
jgi:beta-alanine degradation protein BauB